MPTVSEPGMGAWMRTATAERARLISSLQIGYLVDPYTGRGPDFKHGYNWARRNPDQLS